MEKNNIKTKIFLSNLLAVNHILYINTYLSLSVYFPKKIRGQVKVFHLRYFLNYWSMFCICANECLGPFLHVQNLTP